MQTTIMLFLVIMAVLMIPCSKVTDRWGRLGSTEGPFETTSGF